MKAHTHKLIINTDKKIQFLNITSQVEKAVRESGIKEGICLVNAMHITSSIFINDEEEGLKQDFIDWLKRLAPTNIDKYQHNLTGEINAYAHLWRTIMGREAVMAVTEGELDFGSWEQIFYGEFDGQRQKKVMIKIIGI